MQKKNVSVRTDLAVEAREMAVAANEEKQEGVHVKDHTIDGIHISEIEVTARGEKEIGKKQGSYITVYTDAIKKADTESQSKAAKVVAKQFKKLFAKYDIKEGDKGLIIGLGNWNITPDALGPMTVDKVMVTNHLFTLEDETVREGYRPVAALSPGVMGVTGMETSDIVLSVIDMFKPAFLIAVDALASRSVNRINETIQLTDTGIHPGSGVGNKRKELSKETLDIPVFAIGVPTVVDAVTIVHDTLDDVLKHIGREWKEKDAPKKSLLPSFMPIKHENLSEDDLPNEAERKRFFGLMGTLSEADKRMLFQEVLTPMGKNFIVTPKEVDQYIADMSHLLSTAINASLHPNIAEEEAAEYTR